MTKHVDNLNLATKAQVKNLKDRLQKAEERIRLHHRTNIIGDEDSMIWGDEGDSVLVGLQEERDADNFRYLEIRDMFAYISSTNKIQLNPP